MSIEQSKNNIFMRSKVEKKEVANRWKNLKIDDKVIGGYNQLIEHFTDLGLVNYKGEKIAKNG